MVFCFDMILRLIPGLAESGRALGIFRLSGGIVFPVSLS